MNARKLLLLDLGLLALIVLASRAALAIHEIGGHALPAALFGATRITIRLSTLGGGYVDWMGQIHGWRAIVVSLGGIALNLATGATAWLLSRRRPRPGLSSTALLVFGAGSVAGAVVYLANGFYYGSGDPTGLAPDTGDLTRVQWVWVLFLPAAAVVGMLACRHFAESVGLRGLGWFLATAGVAGAAYGGLWLLLRQPAKEGSTREWRIEREIAKESERRAATAPPPTASAPMPPPPVVVRPEEVRDRIPGPWGPAALFATFGIGGFLGLRKAAAGPEQARISLRAAALLAVLATASAAACRFLG